MSQSRTNATHGFHATMTARPGPADDLSERLLSGAPTSNASCILYLVGRSVSEPDVIHVTEGWTTKEAHAENFARAESQALAAKIAPLVADGAQYQDVVPVGGIPQLTRRPLTRSMPTKTVLITGCSSGYGLATA